jgi:hypothetical protein
METQKLNAPIQLAPSPNDRRAIREVILTGVNLTIRDLFYLFLKATIAWFLVILLFFVIGLIIGLGIDSLLLLTGHGFDSYPFNH